MMSAISIQRRWGDDGVVVRSAAPYTHSLREFLKIDSRLIWFMIILTLFMSFFAYFATRKISTSIKRLNVFAGKPRKEKKFMRMRLSRKTNSAALRAI